ARRVALGVDVGDLLELERSLQREGEVESAAQVEEVGVVGEALGDLSNRVTLPEHDRQEIRELRQSFDHLAHERALREAAREPELEREERDGRELSRKGIRRHDDVLDTGTRVDSEDGVTGKRAYVQ